MSIASRRAALSWSVLSMSLLALGAAACTERDALSQADRAQAKEIVLSAAPSLAAPRHPVRG